MKIFRCKACGYIYSEYKEKVLFENLDNKWHCPICNRKKSQFEVSDEFTSREVKLVAKSYVTPYNAVVIDKNNACIERTEGCINCGMCTKTCLQRVKVQDTKCLNCIGCGQCILTCPKRVLQPKNEMYKFFEAKDEGKICIAYMAPGARVAIGDDFNYAAGSLLGTKLVGLLKKMGFKYVFDVTIGADLTIMEEATELLARIKNNDNLPLITSCCPAWVKYAKDFYPSIMSHLSTVKSPISIMGTLVKNYFAEKYDVNPSDIFTAAITPCTAKKGEIKEMKDTDLVITVSELSEYLKNTKIDFKKIKRLPFDTEVGTGSSAGLIFGSSGGVMESALRTAYYLETKKDLKNLEFTQVRGYNGAREAVVKIGKKCLHVAVVDGLANAKNILDRIKSNTSDYDFIEIMSCAGGCIGGGGQPYHKMNEEQFVKEKRMVSLYLKDKNTKVRTAHMNPSVKKLYRDYYNYPLSPKSLKYLHRDFEK